MVRERCSICGQELEFRYDLSARGVKGHLCGSCYARKLKEIYNIRH